MVLAVGGSVSVEKTFRAQVGDSVIVTNDGYEQLTKHPNALEEVILTIRPIDNVQEGRHGFIDPTSS